MNNIETQSVVSDIFNNTANISNCTSLRAAFTLPQPFHLSRSNSRRSKEVLIKEKLELQKKEQEEQFKLMKENTFKAKEIPVTNYIPDLMVYKSTKDLTSFK